MRTFIQRTCPWQDMKTDITERSSIFWGCLRRPGCIKPECLYEEWTTGSGRKIMRLAFNLYTGWTPTIRAFSDEREKLEECSRYSINELFCCDYAPYFWEAIKLRYPEYTKNQ